MSVSSFGPDLVDLPPEASVRDPLLSFDTDERSRLNDLAAYVADGVPPRSKRVACLGASLGLYAALVARHLRCCKVGSWCSVQGSASVSAVGKQDSSKLRAVWSGDDLSRAAAHPLLALFAFLENVFPFKARCQCVP